MGNFFIVLPSVPSNDVQPNDSKTLFKSGLELAKALKKQTPCSVVERDWVRAALFARANGSGHPIAFHQNPACWLLALGFWLHRYENWGPGEEPQLLKRFVEVGAAQLADELEGAFSLVIGNDATQELFVITDIIGNHHSLQREYGGATFLSGSSMLLAGLGDYTLDPVACQEYINTGVMYEDRTFYQEVKKLHPGSIYHYRNGRVETEHRYWTPARVEPNSIRNLAEACERIRSAQSAVLHKISRAAGRIVSDLTGGYDSRLLTAALLSADVPFSTAVSGPPHHHDVEISHALAEMVGLRHIFTPYEEQVSLDEIHDSLALTDGEYELTEYSRILRVHHKLSKEFDISLNGSFGELLRGYGWDVLLPRTGERIPLDSDDVARIRFVPRVYPIDLYPHRERVELAPHFTGIVGRAAAEVGSLPNTIQYDWVYTLVRGHAWQGRLTSTTNQWWPCLSPNLCRTVLETGLSMDTKIRRRSLAVRYLLAKYHPKLAAYPLDHGYPPTPANIFNLHKFLPMAAYYVPQGAARINRILGRTHRRPQAPSTPPARIVLQEQDEICQMLRPDQMKSVGLYEPKALTDFMNSARQTDFPFDAAWKRILSMESALNAISKVR